LVDEAIEQKYKKGKVRGLDRWVCDDGEEQIRRGRERGGKGNERNREYIKKKSTKKKWVEGDGRKESMNKEREGVKELWISGYCVRE
jgi:hypothetical protein